MSQVAYHRFQSGNPLKMKHGVLITAWHCLQLWLYSGVFRHPSLSLSKSSVASLSFPPSHLLILPPVYPSTSCIRLTAIRHWPCSLHLLHLPQVRPSHNYFLWFTVEGHCHPPKVVTAEIAHTNLSCTP